MTSAWIPDNFVHPCTKLSGMTKRHHLTLHVRHCETQSKQVLFSGLLRAYLAMTGWGLDCFVASAPRAMTASSSPFLNPIQSFLNCHPDASPQPRIPARRSAGKCFAFPLSASPSILNPQSSISCYTTPSFSGWPQGDSRVVAILILSLLAQ